VHFFKRFVKKLFETHRRKTKRQVFKKMQAVTELRGNKSELGKPRENVKNKKRLKAGKTKQKR
jgi:hypothetical protein